jgi:hypothetical protein
MNSSKLPKPCDPVEAEQHASGSGLVPRMNQLIAALKACAPDLDDREVPEARRLSEAATWQHLGKRPPIRRRAAAFSSSETAKGSSLYPLASRHRRRFISFVVLITATERTFDGFGAVVSRLRLEMFK